MGFAFFLPWRRIHVTRDKKHHFHGIAFWFNLDCQLHSNYMRIIDDFAFQPYRHLFETPEAARFLYLAFYFPDHKLFFSHRSLSAAFILAQAALFFSLFFRTHISCRVHFRYFF